MRKWCWTLALPMVASANAVFDVGPFPLLGDSADRAALELAANDAVIADIDGDGWKDVLLLFATRSNGELQQALPDRLYLGGPAGYNGYVAALDAATPLTSNGALGRDFDGDGRIDVLVGGSTVYQNVASVRRDPSRVYRGLGGAFDAPIVLGDTPVLDLASADIDGDARPDIVLLHDQSASLWRNSSSAGQLQFSAWQTLPIGALSSGGRLALGHFDGAAGIDLAVLIANAPGPDGATLQIYARGPDSGAPYAANPLSMALGTGIGTGLATADIDGNGFDDLAISALPTGGIGASRIVYFDSLGPRLGDEQFPAQRYQGVAAGDLDADNRPDLVFSLGRDPQASQSASLNVVLNTAGALRPQTQCLGSYELAPHRVRIASIDGDGLPDLFVLGRAAVPTGTPPGWWRNAAVGFPNLCCIAEAAAQFIAPAARTPGLPVAVNLGTYRRLRDQYFPQTRHGQRLAQRYAAHSAEVVAAMAADPSLWRDMASVLTQWSEPLDRALRGIEGDTVSADMLNAVDALLSRLQTSGSPALVAAIADERAQLPPLSALEGLAVRDFLAAALGSDSVFIHGFEVAP